ncbi:CerR family C-terminal domain-containing protein [Candidatus Binatia bacterium]|nr:CerR family C-terminal domain-containing protein [Candidatus Binatia bacterium]
MAGRDDRDTRERLLRAGSELFAATGLHGATVRDIARAAGANVAAASYHFGSKEALYLEVLRTQFAAIRDRLARRAPVPTDVALQQLSRADLERLIEIRLVTMLEILVGPPPSIYGKLIQREMCDPSAALPNIVEEFIRPQMEEMRAIYRQLYPALPVGDIDRCSFSMVGQVVFYHVMRPAVLRFLGRDEYPRGFGRQLAAHILDFSLGGMDRLAERRRGRARRAS